MGYSQNNEEEIIKKFFEEKELNGKTLCVLDIGANDGKTLSNSLACIVRGWDAVLVEPSRAAWEKIEPNIKSTLPNKEVNVEVHNIAISDKDGTAKFYESGEHAKHYYGENTSLLSSLNAGQVKKWDKEKFTEVEVQTLTFKSFLKRTKKKHFNLITIDAEGYDYSILQQIDLKKVSCDMLIIEHNGDMEEGMKFAAYAAKFDMVTHAKTRENIIFVK